MKILLAVLLLCVPAVAETPCIIFAANSPATGIGTWSIEGRSHKNRLTYLAGDYPPGMTFTASIKAKEVDKIKAKGGRVIVLDPRYTREDLERAKQQCSPTATP